MPRSVADARGNPVSARRDLRPTSASAGPHQGVGIDIPVCGNPPRGGVESTFAATMIGCMTQVAHLSDLHLLEDNHEERRGEARRRLAYISLGRAYEPRARRQRAATALAASRRS